MGAQAGSKQELEELLCRGNKRPKASILRHYGKCSSTDAEASDRSFDGGGSFGEHDWITDSQQPEGDGDFRWQIVTKNRIWHLSSQSLKERAKWIQKLTIETNDLKYYKNVYKGSVQIRSSPASMGPDSARRVSNQHVQPNETFSVCESEEHGNTTWVHLADGRGWLFMKKNGENMLKQIEGRDYISDKGAKAEYMVILSSEPAQVVSNIKEV